MPAANTAKGTPGDGAPVRPPFPQHAGGPLPKPFSTKKAGGCKPATSAVIGGAGHDASVAVFDFTSSAVSSSPPRRCLSRLRESFSAFEPLQLEA